MPEPRSEQEDLPEPLEVEVERLPMPGEAGPRSAEDSGRRVAEVGRVLGPVLAGVAIDLVDAATPFPLLGLLVGWPLGTYLARHAGAKHSTALRLGFLAGLYCAVPMTTGLPVGTLLGAIVKVRRIFDEAST